MFGRKEARKTLYVKSTHDHDRKNKTSTKGKGNEIDSETEQ